MKFVTPQPTAPDVGAHVLTDGRETCTYGALPEIFARLRGRFEEHGVKPGVCLSFECENTVLSALLLLFLLEDGHDFLLTPKRTQGCTTGIEVPSYCGFQVMASRERFTGFPDADFLELVPNGAYRERDGEADGPRLYIRTSGSTGTPKVALHTHDRVQMNARNCLDRFQVRSTDRITIPVPLPHMYGLGAAFLPAVEVGASVDLQNGANVLGYIAREREFQPTRTYLTPTFCESLLKARRGSRAYELTVTAGDRLRGDTFQRYEARFGPLVQLYGSTEMGAVAAARPDDPVDVRAVTVGKPLADVELRLGEAPGHTAGRDDVGELWCRHTSGFYGYADDRGALREGTQAVAGDWFRMNDLGRIDSGGRIQVWGRSDHAVNRSGLLVLFADIEAAIMTIPGVEKAVVVASGESDYGTGLAVFCVPVDGEALAPADIHAACLDRMARRDIPDVIIVADELPALPTGKVDRQALVRMAGSEAASRLVEPEPIGGRGGPC